MTPTSELEELRAADETLAGQDGVDSREQIAFGMCFNDVTPYKASPILGIRLVTKSSDSEYDPTKSSIES